MDLELKDKLIVIAGASAAVTPAIARACIAEGARVVLLGPSSPETKAFLAETRSPRAICTFVEAQVQDPDRCQSAIREIEQAHGDIFGLVIISGATDAPGLAQGSVDELTQCLRTNLMHVYALAHNATPLLKRTQGAIVNIHPEPATRHTASGYAATRGAVLALTREWAVELLPYGIRVNAVLPAEVDAPLSARDAEIAAKTVFLLSPTHSAHTTAQHIFVDGGYRHLERKSS